MNASTTDYLSAGLYSSLSRVLDVVCIERWENVFALMARAAAADVNAFQEDMIGGLRHVADESGLVRSIGPAGVERCIDEAFYLDAAGEYAGLGRPFADACREADLGRRQRQAKESPVRGWPQLSASTKQAVSYLLLVNDADRLARFIAEHPRTEAQLILTYVKEQRQ
jgi:hypothetical protein